MKADKALYKAKETRNAVVVSGMDAAVTIEMTNV
jgi:hypothetical protein